jgi:Fic family protein
MVLFLIQAGLLNFPSLYISGYINQNRSEYYRLLRDVTVNENWGDFITFMLNGFYLQAKDTKETLMKVMSLFFEFKGKLKVSFPKIYSADLVEVLFSYPIVTPVKLAELLGIHYTTASKYLAELAGKGTLKEGRYGKYHLFINDSLMKILKK